MREIPEVVYTHAGRFHADDVFGAALLKILKPEVAIRRVFQLPEDFDGMAFDIGWGEFDHHQSGAPVRENGVPYAAVGLLWREYGASILGETEAGRLDERFIQPIDLDDNTGCGGVIPEMIADFNPRWDSGDDPDQRFAQAVELARQILRNRLDTVLAIGRAMGETMAVMMVMGNANLFPRLLGKGESIAAVIALEMGTAVVGMVLYTGMLSGLSLWILLLVTGATAVNYAVGIRCNKWDAANHHKWHDLDNKMFYLSRSTSSYEASKDVHLYHMPPWLEKLFNRDLKERLHHTVRQQGNYFLIGAVNGATRMVWEVAASLRLWFRMVPK